MTTVELAIAGLGCFVLAFGPTTVGLRFRPGAQPGDEVREVWVAER
jgi:hypothetical protein